MTNIDAWIAVDSYSLVLLLLVLLLGSGSSYSRRKDNLIFCSMIAVAFLLVLVDMVDIVCKASGIELVHDSWLMCLIYIFDPIFYFLTVLYVNYWINEGGRFPKLYTRFLSVVILIHTLVVFISEFLGLKWLYYYDSSHMYHRGPLYYARFVFLAMIFISIEFYLVWMRNSISFRYRKAIMVYPVIGAIAGATQGIIRLPTEYAGMCIVLIILITLVKNRDLRIDYLTGAYNRRSLDMFLENRIKAGAKNLGAIMVDLDFFKEINDTYGHDVGDNALINVVKLLRSAAGTSGHVARYGGDEFVVVLDNADENTLQDIMERIRQKVAAFNQEKHYEYELQMSIGGLLYDSVPPQTDFSEFLAAVDELMYEDKKIHHSNRG